MYLRTYFDKDNVIIKDSTLNIGANPVVDLFFGGTITNPRYSRYLFHFSEDNLRQLYENCELGDLSKVQHTLVMKPTRFFGKNNNVCLQTSYKLCLFALSQNWEEGCGYDFDCVDGCKGYVSPNCNVSNGASNWYKATESEFWSVDGVFDNITGVSYTPTGETVYLQCTDVSCYDCLFKMDITPIVNDYITGGTINYGLGLAFSEEYENGGFGDDRHVGFFSRETTTFFEPYIETVYDNTIRDDRKAIYAGKYNSLYLYTSVKSKPVKLQELPQVSIYDENDNLYAQLTGTCVGLGIYKVDVFVNPTGETVSDCGMGWRDVWDNLIIDGQIVGNENINVRLQPVEMSFEVKPAADFYNFGATNVFTPVDYGMRVRGIRRAEQLKRGEKRRIFIDVLKAYEKTLVTPDELYYRLYTLDGMEELNIIPPTLVNVSQCENWFDLDTSWLIPNIYYIDLKIVQDGQVKPYASAIKFIVTETKICQ